MILLWKLVSDWLYEKHPCVSQAVYHSVMAKAILTQNPPFSLSDVSNGDFLVLYFNGFRIGWVSETEFAIGNGSHYSNMSNFEKISPANPTFFDIIDTRLQRIGA
jgi:hypothetical protein